MIDYQNMIECDDGQHLIQLDENISHYGWVFRKVEGGWPYSVRKATEHEMAHAKARQHLRKGAEQIAALWQPAEQHKGEQVASMPIERCYDVRAKMIIAFNEAKKAGSDLDDCLDSAYKAALRYSPNPLNATADRAEAERLRAVIEQQKNLIESLRADLVESHSIDASAEPCATKCKHPVKCARFDNGEIVDHICQDCLQVFKPSAPVEINERAAFERRFPDFDHTLCSHEDWKDQYDDPKLGDMWNGWQARAALERKP